MVSDLIYTKVNSDPIFWVGSNFSPIFHEMYRKDQDRSQPDQLLRTGQMDFSLWVSQQRALTQLRQNHEQIAQLQGFFPESSVT